MFRFLGKIIDVIKGIFKVLTFRVEWGEETIAEHPKLNRFYEKGYFARFLLFLLSLICVGVSVFSMFYVWGAIFSGTWALIIVLIPIILCLNFPIKFCVNLAGISIYHFRMGIRRGVKKIKSKIKNKNNEENKELDKEKLEPTTLGLEERNEEIVVKENEQSSNEKDINSEKNVTQKDNLQDKKLEENEKPKTRSFSSLLFFIIEGIFTLGIALSVIVIPFTAALWVD